MNQSTSTKFSRYAEIGKIVWKYRKAGLFKTEPSFSPAIQKVIDEDKDLSGQPEELVQD